MNWSCGIRFLIYLLEKGNFTETETGFFSPLCVDLEINSLYCMTTSNDIQKEAARMKKEAFRPTKIKIRNKGFW